MGLIDFFKSKRVFANAVQNSVSISAIPSNKVTNAANRLVKGSGATDHLMNVNGSVTPVDFTYTPASDEIVTVSGMSAVLLDEGIMAATVFGSLATALTNGISIIAKINGVEHEIALLIDNVCFALYFFQGNLGIGGDAGVDGFLNTNDVASAQRAFVYPLTLNGALGDKIIVRVQDDLTGIDVLRMQANTTKILI